MRIGRLATAAGTVHVRRTDDGWIPIEDPYAAFAAEGEIAGVIGRDTTGLTAATAHTYVLGVTAVNDMSSPERRTPRRP